MFCTLLCWHISATLHLCFLTSTQIASKFFKSQYNSISPPRQENKVKQSILCWQPANCILALGMLLSGTSLMNQGVSCNNSYHPRIPMISVGIKWWVLENRQNNKSWGVNVAIFPFLPICVFPRQPTDDKSSPKLTLQLHVITRSNT
jgi:hypothetical protein